MHEFQPIPGLAGRLFGGGAAGLLRRGGGPATPEVAEVRCPRCDSANTKFCYYNNYNLAQPRHFCRACRRYWTKGGLLRNVPVGGGCRKPKPKRPATADADAGKKSAHDVLHRDAKNPRSGCAATSSKPASNASSAVDHQPSCPGRGVSTSPFASGDTPPLPVPPPAPMFADQVAAFASLFAPPPLPAFSFLAQAKAEQRVAPVLTEQPSPASTAHATPFDAVRSGGGLTAGASDWPPPSATDAGMFGLTGAMAGDATLPAYWNPASWTDPEPTMYLP